MMKKLDDMFRHWQGYFELELFPQITPEFGALIYAEMEKYEPCQYTKSIYHDDYARCGFMKAVLTAALERYPVAMEHAKKLFFDCNMQFEVNERTKDNMGWGSPSNNRDYPIRFEYDDQINDAIDKINVALKSHGLILESDEAEHDGFELYRLRELTKG